MASAETPPRFKLALCTQFRRGQCVRGVNCTHAHHPFEEGYVRIKSYEVMPECALFHRFGRCSEPKCKRAHTTEDELLCHARKLGMYERMSVNIRGERFSVDAENEFTREQYTLMKRGLKYHYVPSGLSSSRASESASSSSATSYYEDVNLFLPTVIETEWSLSDIPLTGYRTSKFLSVPAAVREKCFKFSMLTTFGMPWLFHQWRIIVKCNVDCDSSAPVGNRDDEVMLEETLMVDSPLSCVSPYSSDVDDAELLSDDMGSSADTDDTDSVGSSDVFVV
jgi:hypothetical protein